MLANETPSPLPACLPLMVGSPRTAADGNPPPASDTGEWQRLAALTDLVARVSSCDTPAEACQTLAEQLREHCGAEHVAVGTFHPSTQRWELGGAANTTGLAYPPELLGRLAAAADECSARGQAGHWPPLEHSQRHALCAHQQLAVLIDQPSVSSLPLHDAQGHLRGVCLLAGRTTALAAAEHRAFLSAASVPLGSALGLLHRARGHRLDRWLQSGRQAVRTRTSRWLVMLVAIVSVLLCIPLPYQVSCHCELQPVIRRYIAAPFDARLERNHAEPGDVVAAGQLLAQIDARDVGWELSAKQAEAHRVAKELAGHVARHELAEAELANLELQRLELHIEQLQYQITQLEIRSPLSGIVLMGDHAKNEGVPLHQGDTLFEIAPLEHMLIELEIPEDDVRFIRAGMPARVRLDAFPRQIFEGAIERVFPVAELKEHTNVFIAEIRLENGQGQLRPGMRGDARIATVRKSVAWNWFHKPLAAALAWVGW